MAELIIAGAGAYIGGAALGTGVVAMGLTGAQIGWMVGSVVGSMLFAPKGPQTEGPRLQDKTVQVSTYGNMIPRVYGTTRIAGNVIYARDFIEEEIVTEVGKGGGGGGSYTEYKYYATFAASICQGPIVGVRRIWADGIVIFSMGSDNTEAQYDSEVFISASDAELIVAEWLSDGAQSGIATSSLVIYRGTEDQEVDPTISATEGDLTPAFRGQAYAVFNNISLQKFGNRIPNLTFEVVAAGDITLNAVYPIVEVGSGDAGFQGMWRNPETGFIWTLGYNTSELTIFDPMTERIVSQMNLSMYDPSDPYNTPLTGFVDVAGLRQVWVTSQTVYGNWWVKFTYSGAIIEVVDCRDWYEVYGRWYPIGATGRDEATLVMFSAEYPLTLRMRVIMKKFTYYRYDGAQVYYYLPTVVSAPTDWAGVYCNDSVNGSIGTRGVAYNGVHLSYGPFLTSVLSPSYSVGYRVDTLHNQVTFDSKRNRFVLCGREDLGPSNKSLVLMVFLGGSFEYKFVSGAPSDFNSPISIKYLASADVFLVADNSRSAVTVVSAETFVFIKDIPYTNTSYPIIRMADFPEYGDRALTWAGLPSNHAPPTRRSGLWVIPLGDFLDPETVTLSSVITSESSLVGLSPGDLDVSLLTQTVSGFSITTPSSARAIIEQLMVAYQFDAVESSGKVKFVPRGGSPVATLTIDNIAAHRVGEETPVPLPVGRTDENEMPTSVTVKYMVREADYMVGAQEARRQTGNAFTNVIFDLPVVLQDQQAKAVADAALYSTWVARNTVEFTTTFYYADLEPTDIVIVDGKKIRLISKRVESNMLMFKGAFDEGEVYLQGGNATLTPENSQVTINPIGRVFAVLMDTVLLQDGDNNLPFSFYTAASTVSTTWRSATLFRDGTPVVSYPGPSVVGSTTAVLEAYTDNLMDFSNILTVFLINGDLYSATYSALMEDETLNAIVVGQEVMQYMTAVETGDGYYTLTGLLRGRRGSMAVEHAAGEPFVLLNAATVTRPPSNPATRNIEIAYAAIPSNGSLTQAQNILFTNTGQSYDGLAPRLWGSGRNTLNDVLISWFYSARTYQPMRDGYGTPADSRTFSFTVVIYSDATFTTVVRTSEGLSYPYFGEGQISTFLYTAAWQTEDFGSVQSVVYCRVFAYSDLGRSQFYAQGVI
ncbi:MAG: phage tail protein [Fluviibacter phosphoraccumulans]